MAGKRNRKRMRSNLVSIPTEAELAPKSGLIKRTGRTISVWLAKMAGLNETPDLSGLLKDKKLTIIDVGARHGFHPRWEQLGDNLRIILFEPNKDGYHDLLEMYKHDERVKVWNAALSDHDGTITIHIAAFPYSSSAFKHDETFFSKLNFRALYEAVDTVDIPCKRLEDAVQARFDFIKLDVEGFELAVLKGAGDLLDTCIGIEAEVSYNRWAEGLPLFGDVDSFCKSKGFILCRLSPPACYHYIVPDKRLEAHGITFSGDALYFRSPYSIVELIRSNKWNIEKIPAAVVTYLTYGNFEFAYVFIEQAINEKLLNENDELVKEAYRLIGQRSGWNKIMGLSTLRRIKKLLRAKSPDGLDY
jgi:FkbM family methyltransferase